MNLPANFTRQPEFQAFKKKIGHPSALEFLFNLGSRCQVEHKTELYLPVEYIGPTMGFPSEEVDPVLVRDALIAYGFIEQEGAKNDLYKIKLFTDHNAMLRACWKNGSKGGKPAVNATDDGHVAF